MFSANADAKIKRKFILVQIPESIEASLVQATDANSRKVIINTIQFLDEIGKSHTICEIGKERIRRAGSKILEEWKEKEKKTKEGLTEGDLFDRIIQETPNSKLQTAPWILGFVFSRWTAAT
jgi:hypothetical protein